jgi:hypothetical protein
MTLTGWLLKQADKRLGTHRLPVYERFREAYHDSNQAIRASQIQSGSWVIAVITYHLLSNLTNGAIFGIRYPGVAVSAIGVLGLTTSFIFIPIWYYNKNSPFKFTVDWFPLRGKSYLIKKSDEGILRLGSIEEEAIAVVLRTMGTVNGIDIQLVSNNSDIQFKVEGSLGSSLQSYPEDNGFYTDEKVTNEVITPILTVKKDNNIGSGPNPKLYLVDVSSVEYDIRGELSSDEAEKEGTRLLSIEVEE